MRLKNNNISLFGLAIMMPIFISFGSGIVGLDRVAAAITGYTVTFPISFFLALLIVFKEYNVALDRYTALLLLFLSGFSVIYWFSSHNFNIKHLEIVFKMSMFVMVMRAFQFYFKSKIMRYGFSATENSFIIFPILIVILLTLISVFTIGGDRFLAPNIVIYNFHQYYAFFFVLIMGVFLKFGVASALSIFIISLFIAKITKNNTAFISCILLFVFWLLTMLTSNNMRRVLYNALAIMLILLFITYPFVSNALYGTGYLDFSPSLVARSIVMDGFFHEINWYQIFFPVFKDQLSMQHGFHNEFIETINVSGIFGVFFYYFLIVKKVLAYNNSFVLVGTAIFIVVFMAGSLVENTLHPYMMIILAYFISFYYAASKIFELKKMDQTPY